MIHSFNTYLSVYTILGTGVPVKWTKSLEFNFTIIVTTVVITTTTTTIVILITTLSSLITKDLEGKRTDSVEQHIWVWGKENLGLACLCH